MLLRVLTAREEPLDVDVPGGRLNHAALDPSHLGVGRVRNLSPEDLRIIDEHPELSIRTLHTYEAPGVGLAIPVRAAAHLPAVRHGTPRIGSQGRDRRWAGIS